jgi:serine protease AprX
LYGIKIVNLSVSADEEISYHEGAIAKVVQSLKIKGIVIVAAVGNDRDAPILPPANVPEVIAVGGLNDRNTLDPFQQTLYAPTSGWTVDGLLKPELIAPAIWLAAPILPKSGVQKEAIELFTKFDKAIGQRKADYQEQIKRKKLLSPYYQHADGTSFVVGKFGPILFL